MLVDIFFPPYGISDQFLVCKKKSKKMAVAYVPCFLPSPLLCEVSGSAAVSFIKCDNRSDLTIQTVWFRLDRTQLILF